MAIIVDPDNLSRPQVIFGTQSEQISLYPVGALVHANASGATAYTSAAKTDTFEDASADFVTWGVAPGDIVTLFNGPEAAHLIVSAVTDLNTLEIATDDGFTAFSDASSLVYEIRESSGGSIADGVTKQALYSFAKEEWRVDTYATALGDDLIRHEFPDEAITSEQFEIGGGAAHTDWIYFNDYTRKKIRTAGWAEKNTATSTISEYAGIITLGNLESDAQVYYQQVSAQNPPTNFTFLGAINEPIQTYSSGAGAATPSDYRSYLKLFVRKKFFTYAQSEIADIGVTQVQTIVNRFPLTHAADAAITETDAQVIGAAPFHTAASVITDVDGVTSAISSTTGEFRSPSLSTFTSVLVAGDTLFITGTQTDAGYYTISSVTNASTVQLDVTEAGGLTGATGLDYDIFTRIRHANKTGGVANDFEDMNLEAGASAGVALASSNAASCVTAGVTAGDILVITSSTSDHEGVYSIVSVVSENTLQVDATDNPFTSTSGVDFKIYHPSMFLQYKKENISISATGSVVFASATGTIRRDTGTWTGDGVTAGSILTFASTTNNNLSFTVATTTNASTVALVSSDWSRVKDETATGASTTAYDAFKRTINNRVYGFNWKLLGNGNTLADCYQFIQHQLRQTTDIDWGEGSSRGDVTDLLLSYATPTGTTTNMIIDNIDADDTNNATYQDATGQSRTFPFVSSLTINFNTNLQNDSNAKFRMFYTTNPSGNYGTKDAVTVIDSNSSAITGDVGGSPSVQKTFDYDGNTDGGRTAGTDAAVTIVAIGLDTAQFVITTGTITRAKGLSFSLVAPLERNYSNP